VQQRVRTYRDGVERVEYHELYFTARGTPMAPMYCGECKRYVYVPMEGGKVLCPMCGHYSPRRVESKGHEFANQPSVLLEYLPVEMQKCKHCGGDCIDGLFVHYGADPNIPHCTDDACTACAA
jgi:predicted RNA-binding Zn-ribbon protein involved in translation (DUF1610 family)